MAPRAVCARGHTEGKYLSWPWQLRYTHCVTAARHSKCTDAQTNCGDLRYKQKQGE